MSGCHAFAGSSILTLEANCTHSSSCNGSRGIFPRLSAIVYTCSIAWEKAQFLDQKNWVRLPSTKNVFTMSKNHTSISYELNVRIYFLSNFPIEITDRRTDIVK